jgi:hypothetical protein
MKYKVEYLISNKSNNQLGGTKTKTNFIIIGNIRGDSLNYIPELKNQLKLFGNVFEYKFKFSSKRFKLDDLTFESVSKHIKSFIEKKTLSNNIIICLEESSPFGLFFTQLKKQNAE